MKRLESSDAGGRRDSLGSLQCHMAARGGIVRGVPVSAASLGPQRSFDVCATTILIPRTMGTSVDHGEVYDA